MCNVALLKLEDDCCGHGWPTLTHSDMDYEGVHTCM